MRELQLPGNHKLLGEFRRPNFHERALAPNKKQNGAFVLVASADIGLHQKWTSALQDGFRIEAVSQWSKLEGSLNCVKPAVVLLDSDLIQMDGENRFFPLQRLSATAKIIVFSRCKDDRQALLALKAGAKGYCHIDIEISLLRKAVQVVNKGEIWGGRETISRLLGEFIENQNCPNPSLSRTESLLRILTPRETQISRLIAEGACNKEISTRLNISERTVKSHLTSVFQKLQVSDRLRLALLVRGHEPLRF